MKKEKTIFEKIIDRQIPADIIYEDEHTIAFLDAFPFEKGHVLVVPKKSFETIFEMNETEFLELQKVVYKVSKKINEEIGGGLNILQNNFSIAGQVVPHVHFHIVPRNEKKELYCKNKIEYSREEKDIIFKKIKF